MAGLQLVGALRPASQSAVTPRALQPALHEQAAWRCATAVHGRSWWAPACFRTCRWARS